MEEQDVEHKEAEPVEKSGVKIFSKDGTTQTTGVKIVGGKRPTEDGPDIRSGKK